jgi:hypothetical protein
MRLVHLRNAACETAHHLNAFEQIPFQFWGTESATNKEYLQTQAYRTFRIHVLLNTQNSRQNPLNTTRQVSCHLSDNYILKFDSFDYIITLMRHVDVGSENILDTEDTFDSIKF